MTGALLAGPACSSEDDEAMDGAGTDGDSVGGADFGAADAGDDDDDDGGGGADQGDGDPDGGGPIPDDDDDDDDSADDDDDSADDDDDDDDPPADDPEVPTDSSYCAGVAGWDAQWSAHEMDILDAVNAVRATGYDCGSAGSFGPAPALTMQPNLRCAARVHSKDMDERNFFEHTNPSGESPFDRMILAGYEFYTAGENIAAGSPDAAGTMDQWLNSAGHCSNMMNPDFEEIGVGYHPGGQYGHLWTQVFGAN